MAAWPDGVPDLEETIWYGLDVTRREEAARRISALLGYEREGDWRRWADGLGFSKPGWFTLLRRWRGRRSLTSVLPQLKAYRGRGPGGRLGGGVAGEIARVVAEHRDWSRQRIVEEVRRSMPRPPAASSLRTLIDRERTRLERVESGDEAAFGLKLVVAGCPVALRSPDAGPGAAAHGGFVVDLATGRVLGSGVDDRPTAALRAAALDAARTVATLPAREDPGAIPELVVHLAGTPDETEAESMRLAAAPFPLVVIEDAGRTIGRRALELVGPKIGMIDLRPRAVLPEASTPSIGGERSGDAGIPSARGLAARLAAELADGAASMGAPPPLATDPVVLGRALGFLAGS